MRYLSVCSGIEAATVAWESLGWTPVAFSEIDAFPCAVLAHHYPETPNWGDLTRFQEWPDATVDVLVGGTPCQSFSVAGLRAGLADPCGNLMFTYLAVAGRYRPRWVVWENVPGVLSSNGGRDFGTFLTGLAELGYGFAYRVLDAQYFGLAQRRKRVFVVGYLGDWRRAAAVLLERSSLSGHPPPRRETGEGVTHELAPGLTASGRGVERCGESRGQDPVVATVAPTLREGGGFEAAVFTLAIRGRGDSSDLETRSDGTANALLTPNGGRGGIGVGAVASGLAVRRLTPKECARLQGFPDDYLDIVYRGKPAADGNKYKALGNSMAVPVMRWIGRRIAAVGDLPLDT